jgi:hypothetical protein
MGDADAECGEGSAFGRRDRGWPWTFIATASKWRLPLDKKEWTENGGKGSALLLVQSDWYDSAKWCRGCADVSSPPHMDVASSVVNLI